MTYGTKRAFTPTYDSEKKVMKINLEKGNNEIKNVFSCSIKSYNQFIKIIIDALEFNSKELVELKWSEKREEYLITFSWMKDTKNPLRSTNLTVTDIINEVLRCWTEEAALSPLNAETSEWKHFNDLNHFKILWINKLFKRLVKVWNPKENKFPKNHNEILTEVGKKINKYVPLVQKIGNIDAVVGEERVCNDPKIILGLLLSNPKEYFEFKDSVPSSKFNEEIYYGNLPNLFGDSYYGVKLIWESRTREIEEFQYHDFKGEYRQLADEYHKLMYESRQAILPFDNYKRKEKALGPRAWIIEEKTFTGKRRIVARKNVLGRNKKVKVVTTGSLDVKNNDEIDKKELVKLIKTIFGPSFRSEEKFRPLTNREIPFSDSGIEYLANSLMNVKDKDISKKALAKKRVEKHRLGSKLIEVGQFLEWWGDFGDIFFDIFSKKGLNQNLGFKSWDDDRRPELPLRILGSGVKRFFDMEYDNEGRSIGMEEM